MGYTMEAQKMFSLKEVAARLECHPATVRTMILNGSLKGIRIGAARGHYRVAETALADYLDRAQVVATKQGRTTLTGCK